MTPQVFAEAMESALKVLERRAEESGRDRAPFERSLAGAEKELAEIERSRIRAYLPPDELNRMEREALSRRQAARQALAEVSSDLAGMHETVNLLHRAQESLDVAKAASSSGHFTEAPPVWLTDVLPEPAVQPFVDGPADAVYDTLPDANPAYIAQQLGQVLDLLRADITVTPDGHIEVRGVVNLRLPDDRPRVAYAMTRVREASTSACRASSTTS